jgi:hypothetical protein
VQRLGCAALQNLAFKNPDNKERIGAVPDAFDAIVAAIVTHPKVANVQRYGCGALFNLSVHAPNVARLRAVPGAVAALRGAHARGLDSNGEAAAVLKKLGETV